MTINIAELMAHNSAQAEKLQRHRIKSLNWAREQAARQRTASTPAASHVSAKPTPDPAPAARETGTAADTGPARYTPDGRPMRGPGTTRVGTRADGTTIVASDITDRPESAYETLASAVSLTSTGEAILSILRRTEADDGIIRNEHDYQRQLAEYKGWTPAPPLPSGYDGRITSEDDYQALLRHHKWQQKNRR